MAQALFWIPSPGPQTFLKESAEVVPSERADQVDCSTPFFKQGEIAQEPLSSFGFRLYAILQQQIYELIPAGQQSLPLVTLPDTSRDYSSGDLRLARRDSS
jgi:hypothetical protein